MKQCFGYIRVSTQKQGEGVSLEAQKDAITVFASQNGLVVTRWFEEKETAAKRGRPIFNQMLKLLKSGGAQGLIIHKIDRSARNLRDWALVSELPNIGIDIFFATESLDFRSRGGRLAANLQAVIAEDYIFNLREESIKGMNGRLKQGLYPWGAPPGYLDQGGGKPKIPCPKTAPLIKLLFELYASRQYSYTALLEEMHRRGLRNRRGGRLSLCGLGNILQNPFYIGLNYIKSTDQIYEGIHEPIVSTRIWKRVQDIRTGRSGPKITRHNHLFQGLFRCAQCGNPLVPELQKERVYYRCKRKGCLTKTVREDVLEQAIVDELKNVNGGVKFCHGAEQKSSIAWVADALANALPNSWRLPRRLGPSGPIFSAY
ncbi:recombinase family protein [Ruegeria sp. EL01]|uniref:recombinase family protein n=1 Tax=Ruegeria sp. EL01 TaxID=2107578 RepID=UPI000EA8344C|nr:recombinase family protein [Ruegeria sp. EL01]